MFTASQVANKKFEIIPLAEKWKTFIGEPEKNFTMMLSGSPGHGKSTLALQLMNELALHGKALYIPSEEGMSKSIADKINRLKMANSSLLFDEWTGFDALKKALIKHKIDFLCLDSITHIDSRLNEFETFRTWCKEQEIAVVYVSHATKTGHYKGNSELEHMVDISVWVNGGVAETRKNRFAPANTMEIVFELKEESGQRTNPTVKVKKIDGVSVPGKSKSDVANADQTVSVPYSLSKWHTDPVEFCKHFAIKGVEFGNWLSEKEKMEYLANTAQQLEVLASYLGVKDSQIGFNGILSICFGSRGIAYSLAHYNPNSFVINLNKVGGYESLAHEYGHFLDHMTGIVYETGNLFLASKQVSKEGNPLHTKMKTVLDSIVSYEGYKEPDGRKKGYYASHIERWARTFETYVFYRLHEKGLATKYLTHKEAQYKYTIYPPKKFINDHQKTIEKFIQKPFRLFTEKNKQSSNTVPANQGTGKDYLTLKNTTTIDFKADGSESVKGTYQLIEADLLIPSHNSDGSVNTNHQIGKGQPRDRSGKDILHQPKLIAQKINPVSITKGNLAFVGAPVVNALYEVIQGNGRAMALKIVWNDFPEKAAEYKKYLVENAAEFGLNTETVKKAKKPVLVRVIAVNDKEAIRLGNITDTSQAKMPKLDQAKAIIRNLDEATIHQIGTLISNAKADTLGEVIDEHGSRIIRYLSGLDTTGLFNNKGDLTSEGKEFLKTVFNSLIFDSETEKNALKAFNEKLPHDIKRGIERSFGNVLALMNNPQTDIRLTLQQAIIIIAEYDNFVKKYNNGWIYSENIWEVFVKQSDSFTGSVESRYPIYALQISHSLVENPKQKVINDRFKHYQRLVSGYVDMFDSIAPISKEEAISLAFSLKARLNPDKHHKKTNYWYFNQLTKLVRPAVYGNKKIDEHYVEYVNDSGKKREVVYTVKHEKKAISPYVPFILDEKEAVSVRKNPKSIILGVIDESVAKAIKRESGIIVLTEEGKEHIQKHAKELNTTVSNAVRMVSKTGKSYDCIYEDKGALLLTKQTDKTHLVIIRLAPDESGKPEWIVKTAFITRPDFLKNKKLLWERAQSNQSEGSSGAITSHNSYNESKYTEKVRKNPYEVLASLGKLKELVIRPNKNETKTITYTPNNSVLMLCDAPGETLFLIESEKVQKSDRKIKDVDAEEMFKEFNHYEPDGKDFEFTLESTKKKFIGFASHILYESDKIMQKSDKKGKMNTYVHHFDSLKRPVYLINDNLIVIENLMINVRGIIN